MLRCSAVRTASVKAGLSACGRCGPCKQSRVICRVSSSASSEIDYGELGKYVGATAFQAAAITAVTYGLDQVLHMDLLPTEPNVQAAAVWLWFAFLSVRSRTFACLDATRPSVSRESKGFDDRKRPSWCPPKIVFPIVWSTITLLRATAATIVWQTMDHQLLVVPILAFILHLCLGDTWNYINNSQAKLGVGLAFNLGFVWTSAAAVDALYFGVDQTAGLTLLPMNIWLSIAGALLFSIWDLNGRQELLPTKSST